MMRPFLLSENDCVVFDLDDTLYKEISFVKSGIKHCLEFAELSASDQNVYNLLRDTDWISSLIEVSNIQVSREDLLNEYRTHLPTLELENGVHYILDSLSENGVHVGVVSDGRSITQRNKLSALAILEKIDTVIISEEIGSEKPSKQNFKSFDKFENRFYIGDNPRKDFLAPNSMGWTTIMLLNSGENIHEQNVNSYSIDYHPHLVLNNLANLIPQILSFG